MSFTAIANVLPFASPPLSRRDRVMIEEWRAGAASHGIAEVNVRDEGLSEQSQPMACRITIRFQPGIADGNFLLIQRAAGSRTWVTLRLRVEPDGTMTLPIGPEAAFRQNTTLRAALNAVRPVLPAEDCRILNYQTAAQTARARHSHAIGSLARAT